MKESKIVPNSHSGNERRLSLTMLLFLFVAPLVSGQEPTITPNYRDADIRQIVEAVGEVTGKNFILDPRIQAKVTMLSSTPMSPEAFYEAFLSILEVNKYVAITTGDIVKIIPDASARQYSGLLSTEGAASEDIVTQVVQVRNVGAAQLVPILRPLIRAIRPPCCPSRLEHADYFGSCSKRRTDDAHHPPDRPVE